jgi:hypothetical protein
MIPGAKYGHTNLIAQDWRALARFYQEQFGCTPVPPERDFKGKDLERGTGIPGVELRRAPAIAGARRAGANARDLRVGAHRAATTKRVSDPRVGEIGSADPLTMLLRAAMLALLPAHRRCGSAGSAGRRGLPQCS